MKQSLIEQRLRFLDLHGAEAVARALELATKQEIAKANARQIAWQVVRARASVGDIRGR